MKTILVTGGNGQLGQELKRLSDNHAASFIFTDTAELDITDRAAVTAFFDAHQIDVCINCAAYTAVDRAEEEQAAAHRVNVAGPENLALACQHYGAMLLHISTDFVFDGKACRPYPVTATAAPLGVYGETKRQGEVKVLEAHPEGTAIVRTSWLYSAYGGNFVKTMLRLGKERESLQVIADQVGTPTWARDLAVALLAMADRYFADDSPRQLRGIYHFSNEGVASWYDFAKAVFDLAGLPVTVRPIPTEAYPTPATRPAYSVLDKSHFKQTFNVAIPYWRDSLAACLKEIAGQTVT